MSRRVDRKQKERKQRKRRNRLICAAIIAICVAYLIVCGMVPKKKIVSGVYINGVNVGGMTESQAKDAVQEAFDNTYADAALTVRANDQDYIVSVYNCLSINAERAAETAVAYAHGNFLTRGIGLLRAKILKKEYTCLPQVADEELLRQDIEAAGLMEINTTVQTTYEVTKSYLVLTKGITGVSVDQDKLVKEMETAIETADYKTVIECPMLTGTVDATDLQAVYDAVHTEKSDATLDPKNDYKIIKSVRGVSFDVASAQTVFEKAAEGKKVVIPLDIDNPKITTKKLKKYLFRDVLGSCSTYVSGTSARVSNVALAAKKINGTILLPGETFSYNNVVGERTAERGFQKAPAYSNGESVQELGGGICQVSSTLYKATLLSNLKIVEHHNHSYVSSYIGIGMDATVSWGGPDYQFKNNTDYPIKIAAEYSGGQVTCKIYGAKLDKKKVEMTAETLKVTSCDTVYQDDETLEKGTTEVVTSGHDGYVVQTYRNIYNGKGELISSEKEAYCVYRKQDRVVRVGMKEPEIPEEEPETPAEEPGEITE